MFKKNKIKYIRTRKTLLGDTLFIKYYGEPEKLLTAGKVDLKDFKQKQKPYYREAIKKRNKMAENWEERHNKYLEIIN